MGRLSAMPNGCRRMRKSIGLMCWARRHCIGRTLRHGHRCRRGTRRRRRQRCARWPRGARTQRCRWEKRRMSVAESWRFCSRGRELSGWAWVGRWQNRMRSFPRSVRGNLRPLRRAAGYAASRRAVRGGGLRAGRQVGRDGLYAAGTVCGGGGAIPSIGVVGRAPRRAVGAFHRGACRGPCGGCVVAERCMPRGSGAWPVDAGAARRRRDDGGGGERSGGAAAARSVRRGGGCGAERASLDGDLGR